MADFNFSSLIDSLNPQIAAGGPKIDFSTIADLPKTIDEARARRSQQELRDAFKGGVPTDASGQPDYAAMAKTLFQRGGLEQGVAASNLGIQRDQLKMGQQMSERMGQIEGGGLPTNNLPPSTSRNASTPVARPIGGGQTGGGSSQPAQGGQGSQSTIMQVATAAGIPNDQLGAVSASLARQLGVDDPNAPLDMSDPRVRGVIVPAIQQFKRAGVGQVIPDGAPTPAPQVMPQPPGTLVAQAGRQPPAAPVQQVPPQPAPQPPTQPRTGALMGSDPDIQKRIAIYTSIASNPAYPKSVQEAALSRLKALQSATEPTPDMKNASASGMSLQDYQNRSDDNTAQRDILNKSILPKLDKSQETAQAARDEIQAIHQARQQLDAPGGIFTGTAADVRLKLAKAAELIGVQNADKITNTEAFGSAIGSRVLSLVKGLGAGAGISNADRDFASAMAGGNIKLDETSIRRALDLGEKAARVRIDQHNSLADRTLTATEALKGYRDVYRVQAPGSYEKQAASDPYAKARAAIAAGAPRDAVMQRMKQFGLDAGKL
jgi:hypothetical protein